MADTQEMNNLIANFETTEQAIDALILSVYEVLAEADAVLAGDDASETTTVELDDNGSEYEESDTTLDMEDDDEFLN